MEAEHGFEAVCPICGERYECPSQREAFWYLGVHRLSTGHQCQVRPKEREELEGQA